MFAKINSCHLLGIDGVKVDVEADVSTQGLPSYNLVGLAEAAVKESRERVRSSLKNLGYNIFARPITINLAPADFKKEGTHFDLPIAVALLIAAKKIDEINLDDTLFIGELSLDGKLRAVAGVLPITEYAKRSGLKRIILPTANALEASLISDIDIYHSDNLAEIIASLQGLATLQKYERPPDIFSNEQRHYNNDFKDVLGQFLVRRAAEIAASGMHNMIMIGSPGSGKTMIARRMPSILPPMSVAEALETTKIHSVAGLLRRSTELINQRPFVAPHHTASSIAIIGGGSKARPGHVSIANSGVLFLDEMLEFNRSVLEVLRQPLEDREVTVARAGRTITYPAKFMLIGAMNPCPCGYFGDKIKECRCTVPAIERYRAKLSCPMLDRIDLQVRVSSVDHKDLTSMKEGESSDDIRQRVVKAHDRQLERFAETGVSFNSYMSEADVKKYCALDEQSGKILAAAMKKYDLSARSYNKILKISRTIADLAASKDIRSEHILEALQYRISDSI